MKADTHSARSATLGGPRALPERIGFRFFLLYFLLVLLPKPFTPADALPRIPGVNRAIYNAWRSILQVVVDALGWQGVDTRFNYGGGDAFSDYLRVGCCVAFAVFGTLMWCVADRVRTDYPRLLEALRIYLRVVLGVALISYALAKLVGQQFAFSPIRLFQPVGQLEPMALLWLFMGYGQGYTLFTGLVELGAGLLLFIRRTTTLGALCALLAMTHVLSNNLVFDGPVKLYSLQLSLIAAFLLAPDLRRLFDFFVLRRSSWLREVPPLVPGGYGVAIAIVAKLVLLGLLANGHRHSFSAQEQQQATRIDDAVVGMYEVTSQVSRREPESAAAWRRVVIQLNGSVDVQMIDDSIRSFSGRTEGDRSLFLTGGGAPTPVWFQYQRTGTGLSLVGQSEHVDLARIAPASIPLVARQFRWVRNR